jgi:hypothetical protein
VERLRRVEGIGPSEAVNRLLRIGLAAQGEREPYRHESRPLGQVDVTDIGAVLDWADDL